MDEATTERLVAINRTFYARFFRAFDETRTRPWPGWGRVLDATSGRSVLDLGCGNGRFAAFLAERFPHRIDYVGWDDNRPLLARAKSQIDSRPIRARWAAVDLTAASWPDESAELVVAFGVIHHIPSFAARRRFIAQALERVTPGGHLAVCFWQFAPEGVPRVATAPWSDVGIDPEAVEADDHLVLWRRGGDGRRYCHHTSAAEVDRLFAGLPGSPADRFCSDGATADLNLYVVHHRPA